MTYQLNTGLPDDLAAEVKAFAGQYGITIAAAVRILLRQALENEGKP
jgi:antitoxin component of RelBE/YafQ-DinJ toxin-antitoxin module